MKQFVAFLLFVTLGFGCSSNKIQTSHSESSQPHIYVFGDFKQAGQFPWTNGVTVIDAIQLAGGFTDFAGQNLYVLHLDGTRQIYRRTSEGQFTNDIILRPDDKVVSPGGRIF
jgi:polysaccharide export outer membrane protein